ncbi:agamous-like MADS-box protein MADS9 [Spinacia oleracea]|uniref:Floral homeotic protein PMADS 2-like n=1 Tax=Spinacia oleracea TaxID=3562 RepID=D4N1M5_SPIOL|nr:agamous-like MADS-box protein MADS9 [Spinacia oleracea]ADD14337.1 PISTILLATA [Spinacia oleracea]
MGRGKIEIKRIENSTNRQVTYSKRRNGIIKKATEINVLCDSMVSVVIFANNGKMHAYNSPSTPVEDILEKYQNISGKRLWDAKHEELKNEIDRIKKENDDMRVELRHLNGEDIASLQYPDLSRLEQALDIGIARNNDRQMEIYKMHEKNTTMLQEENNQLEYMLHKQENEMMDGPGRNNPEERDYLYQIPYGFRGQPNQQGRV